MDEYEENEDDPTGTIRPMVWVILVAIALVAIASLLTYLGTP